MSPRLRALGVVATAVVLVLSGCSSDGSDGSDGAAGADNAAGTADAAACPQPADPADGADGPGAGAAIERTLQVGDVEREYVAWLPDGYDGTVPVPVVGDFHGAGGTARGHAEGSSGLATLGPERGYLVVAGQATANSSGGVGWQKAVDEAPDDVAYFRAVLDDLAGTYCVDRDRVYATGFSSGAGFTAFASCEMPELAAVAPLAGINLVRPCVDAPPMPVVSFHGDADTFVAFEGMAGIDDVTGTTSSFIGDVSEVMDVWAQRNGCDPARPAEQTDDEQTVRTHAGCPDGADVVLHVLPGADHIYPGGGRGQGQDEYVPGEEGYSGVPAAQLVLDFFDAHPRR